MSSRRGAARGVALVVSAVAAAVVFYVAVDVFPYHSTNHDEGVYLQQAAALLDGRLTMRAPTEGLVDAFRPWFFVVDTAEMYPKYSPVTAAVFALGELLGGARLSLAAVAFADTYLVYLVVREGFDEAVAVVASVLLVLSPLFVVNTSLFLPYATTAAFNLVFALGYVRAFLGREDGVRYGYAALAGFGAGVSFFSRPYTAVLFTSPFVVHALGSLYARRRRFAGYAVLSSVGLALVGVTLAYNHAVTGSATTFPYLELAPRDGLGFGRRAILGYERDYTPLLGLRANARALIHLAADWTTAGVAGSALAAVGVLWAFVGAGGREKTVRLLLVGVFVSFVVGNVYFWGTLNTLGELGDPTDGLVSLYGPYYHYDLLLPVSAFTSYGAVSVYRRFARRVRTDRNRVAAVALAVGLVAAASFGAVAVGEVNEKVDRNERVTEVYEEAYEPFEKTDLRNAVVFLPTPYGDWLNHPFQYLRNSPDLSGDVVYALDRGADNLDVVDAYPNRTYHRYSYRGEWEPYTGETIEPDLSPLKVVEGEAVRMDVSVDAANASSVSVSLVSEADGTLRDTRNNGSVSVRVRADGDEGVAYLEPRSDAAVSVRGRGEVEVTVHVVRGYIDESTYRLTLPAEVRNGAVRAVSPEVERCPRSTGCRGSTAYVSNDGEVTVDLTPVSSDAPGPGP